jgi:hypothetical protein
MGVMNKADAEYFERTRPRPFDLSDPKELDRLLQETLGYARVSLHQKDGTDLTGRKFAFNALYAAIDRGYKLVPPDGDTP